jgi:hypothetical protein
MTPSHHLAALFLTRERAQAAGQGNSRMVRALIDMGASVNLVDEDGRSALHFAVRRGHVGALGVLLKLGAKVNMQAHAGKGKGETGLHLAVGHAYLASIRLLIQVRHAYRRPPSPAPLLPRCCAACGQACISAGVLSLSHGLVLQRVSE